MKAARGKRQKLGQESKLPYVVRTGLTFLMVRDKDTNIGAGPVKQVLLVNGPMLDGVNKNVHLSSMACSADGSRQEEMCRIGLAACT